MYVLALSQCWWYAGPSSEEETEERLTQILSARNTKHATFLQFFGKWNDVKVKETDLALVPVDRRVNLATALLVCRIHFRKSKKKEMAMVGLAIMLQSWQIFLIIKEDSLRTEQNETYKFSFHFRKTCQCCIVWDTSDAWIRCSSWYLSRVKVKHKEGWQSQMLERWSRGAGNDMVQRIILYK